MFNSTKIKYLERKLENKDFEICKLNTLLNDRNEQIHKLEGMIREITVLKDKKPDNCISGSYCKGCEWVKEYTFSTGLYVTKNYICGKGNCCSEFIQKKGDC